MNYKQLSQKYKPDKIKYLLLLDAPPYSDQSYYYDSESNEKDYYIRSFVQAFRFLLKTQ